MTSSEPAQAPASKVTLYERNFESGLEGKYRQVADLLRPASRVLDVGGSTGYFAEALAGAGHQVVLLDGDAASVAAARDRGIEAFVADLGFEHCFTEVTGSQFDAMLFMDVLEHLEDPAAVLIRARDLLAPNGRIIVTGPNVAYWAVRWKLLRGKWDYANAGIMDRTHLRWFTLSTWCDLVTSAGYTVSQAGACEGMLPKEQWLGGLVGLGRRLAKLRALLMARRPGLWGTVILIVARPSDRSA